MCFGLRPVLVAALSIGAANLNPDLLRIVTLMLVPSPGALNSALCSVLRRSARISIFQDAVSLQVLIHLQLAAITFSTNK